MTREVDDLLTVQSRREWQVVEFLRPELTGRLELDRAFALINDLADQAEQPRLVISFMHVNYVSSECVGKLIALARRVQAKHGEVQVAHLNPRVREIFEMTRVLDMVAEYRSQKEQTRLSEAARRLRMRRMLFLAALAMAAAVGIVLLVLSRG